MKKRIKVGVIFGGRSAEHEISLLSARNVIDAIDKDKYDVVLIGIDKGGKWYLNDNNARFLLEDNKTSLLKLNTANSKGVTIVPTSKDFELISTSDGKPAGRVDVIFPVLHGPFGEDGTVQGLLKLANIPFVGADVIGSAIGMDKEVTKRLLRDAGIPIAKFLVFERPQKKNISFNEVRKKIGLPFFAKPVNLGSSVGVCKVKNKAQFEKAIEEAFEYDNKILIEEYVKGREIECSVLGNYNPVASVPGEILPRHEFYSYVAKYLDENGAMLEVPAKLSKKTTKEVQDLAVKTFRALCCKGMARVDFFLRENGEVVVNEINTIPGFTKISMYPKMWEASGISYKELIDRLIQLALERFEEEKKLKTSY